MDKVANLPRDENSTTRPRMRFFRSADAMSHGEVLSYGPLSDIDTAGVASLQSAGAPTANEVVCIFREAGATNMSICRGWFKSHFPLPRHSHSSDCIYYIIGGEMRMGSVVLRVGDGVFIPANQAYTFEPGDEGVEVLEIRNAVTADVRMAEGDPERWSELARKAEERRETWTKETIPPSRR